MISWSPRSKSKYTCAGKGWPASSARSVARTNDLTVAAKGKPSISATAAQVLLPGVGNRCISWDAAGRGFAGGADSAFSILAA
jgi:hypothetical protein